MVADLDTRLARLKAELDDHTRVAQFLGLDFDRPIRSLGDGYPENAVSLVGKITERLLKQLWRHENVPGDPAGKSLSELIKGCRPHINSSIVLDALTDIQRMRNRSSHDGYEIVEEDGLVSVRRLLDVLSWFTDTGSSALLGDTPGLESGIAKKIEFLAGAYATIGYRMAKLFELSPHTVYQLLRHEAGLRSDYVELLVTNSLDDLRAVLQTTGGDLLRTTLPKTTRFLVLEQEHSGELREIIEADYRVLSYGKFVEEALIDLRGLQLSPLTTYPRLPESSETLKLAGDMLSTEFYSGSVSFQSSADALLLVRQLLERSSNVLLVGKPGSGKTTLLKQVLSTGVAADPGRTYCYLDLGLKRADEQLSDFVARTLDPFAKVARTRVFELFQYLVRCGVLVCALDGIDEAVHTNTLSGYLDLFAEISELLSAQSAVVMTTRVSFLEDSPYVRQLLDKSALASERLAQQLHANGIDPLQLPSFSILRLEGHTADGKVVTPLERRLADTLDPGADLSTAADLAAALWAEIRQTVAAVNGDDALQRMTTFFGAAFLASRKSFPLFDIYNELGHGFFDGSRLELESLRIKALFRPAGDDRVCFKHSIYQEILAAEYLRVSLPHTDIQNLPAQLFLTEQLRSFLHERSGQAGSADAARDCILLPGTYLVGPSHHLMLRRILRAVRFDRHAVTVARYLDFLAAVEVHGSTSWDHPNTPPEHTHQPWFERLRIPDYYTNPHYRSFPAVCVDWWSAYAFARHEGKRLPTALEWEAAGRGADGRLFPWGDAPASDAVNCADSWSDTPLVTYESWHRAVKSGRLHTAQLRPVDAHPRNTSANGIVGMSGNVWEWTGTVFDGEAAICGGSFDNPLRAVQLWSKGAYRLDGRSNAVGFRCAEEL